MMLVRPPMTNFKMTVRADCAVSAYSPLPPAIKALAPGWTLDRHLPSYPSTLPRPAPYPTRLCVCKVQNPVTAALGAGAEEGGSGERNAGLPPVSEKS